MDCYQKSNLLNENDYACHFWKPKYFYRNKTTCSKLVFRYFLIWCEKFVPEKLILTEQLQAKKKKVREKKLSVSSCKQNKIIYFALVEKRRFLLKESEEDSFGLVFLSPLSISTPKDFPGKSFVFGGYWLKPKSLLFYFFIFVWKKMQCEIVN